MKAATVNEIKQELQNTSAAKVTELCLRLARFKKENKELLTYLLFEAHDTTAYIESVKQELEQQFEEMNKSSVYFMKKTLRKILRSLSKYNRYCGLPAVEIELLIYFCTRMKALDLPLQKNPVLQNMYEQQLKKINKAVEMLHEDLQYDYIREIKKL